MQCRTQANQTAGRGGAAVSLAATTEAPLLPGDATAACETAKGGAVDSRAEGLGLEDRSQGRTVRVEAKGRLRRATWKVTSQAKTTGPTREVVAGSAVGRWPNPALQRITALLRFRMNLNGHGWAARAEGGR